MFVAHVCNEIYVRFPIWEDGVKFVASLMDRLLCQTGVRANPNWNHRITPSNILFLCSYSCPYFRSSCTMERRSMTSESSEWVDIETGGEGGRAGIWSILNYQTMEYWKITVAIFPFRQSLFPIELLKLPWRSPQIANTRKYFMLTESIRENIG